MTSQLKLIVGLGNPGNQYEKTRHNAGFWFIDTLLSQIGESLRHENKFHGDVLNTSVHYQNIWLLKPDTFMNKSGQAIAALANFYKIEPEQILVVHDELDLPPGSVRFKTGGGHGGHNGLKDTVACLGSKSFHRLRIGIGHPGQASKVTGYVLGKASIDDHIEIEHAINRAIKLLPEMISGKQQLVMNTLHSEPR